MAALPEDLADLIASQHGVLSRSQALTAGMSPAAVRTELARGRWHHAAPSVYLLAGHGRTWTQRLWVAQLQGGPGSCCSFESAGRLNGFDEVPAGLVVLSVPHAQRRRIHGARVHRVDDLAPHHVVELDGLRVTTPARTIVDLAAVLHIARLRVLVEHAVVDRRASLAQVGAVLDTVRRKGKPGVTRLCRVLDDLGPGTSIPNGELERMFEPVLIRSGLPRPLYEHPLPGVGPRAGFVDRYWPDARMIVELDGRRWHTRRQQLLVDQDRTLQAQAAGIETTRLLWEHVVHDPDGTAAALRSIHERRLAAVRP